jgi:hypothetical protein
MLGKTPERIRRPGGSLSTAKSSHLPTVSKVESQGTQARVASLALFVCVAYYLGSRVGLALTFQPHPISTLWPPNAILLAGLLLAPMRSWWVILLAALPAHVAADCRAACRRSWCSPGSSPIAPRR